MAKFRAARKASRGGDYATAARLYGESLANGAWDATAIGEWGYAALQLGKLDLAEDCSLAAGAAASDLRSERANVRSMVWYNLGLIYEQWKASEPSRAAFARALAVRNTRAAADKLGGRSRCTAEIYLGDDALERRVPCRASGRTSYGRCRPDVYYETASAASRAVRGWVELARAMGHEVETETAARAVACDFAFSLPGDPPQGRPPVPCDESPPWHVVLPAPGYKVWGAFFVPTGPDTFFFDSWMDGGASGACEPSTSTDYEVRGAVAVRDTTTLMRSENAETKLEVTDSRRCWEGPEMHEKTVFSLNERKPVVRVRTFTSHPEPTVAIDPEGTQLTLSGAGCDRVIEL